MPWGKLKKAGDDTVGGEGLGKGWSDLIVQSMKNNLLVSLFVAVCSMTFAGVVCAEEPTIGFHTYESQITGTVEDTNYVLHPMLFAAPSLTGGDIRVESITGSDGGEVPALVTKALRQAKNIVPVGMDHRVESVLKAHRKVAGLGVHGPLKVTGKLFLVIVPKGDKYTVSGSLTPASLTGPRGSWSK